MTKYPIVKCRLCIDDRTSQSEPYAGRPEEINFPIPGLNPGDEAAAVPILPDKLSLGS